VWLEVIEKFTGMRRWVAQNKTVPVVVLEMLRREHDADVRSFVAMKRKLPETVQLLLASVVNYCARRISNGGSGR
jgi:hypothetical protein